MLLTTAYDSAATATHSTFAFIHQRSRTYANKKRVEDCMHFRYIKRRRRRRDTGDTGDDEDAARNAASMPAHACRACRHHAYVMQSPGQNVGMWGGGGGGGSIATRRRRTCAPAATDRCRPAERERERACAWSERPRAKSEREPAARSPYVRSNACEHRTSRT